MKSTKSLILTYKGKVLLFSHENLLQSEKDEWDFLRMGTLNKTKISDFLQKEINLPAKITDANLVNLSIGTNEDSELFHFRLTDDNVNCIKRKSGWRIEFYRLEELDKVALSFETRSLYQKYKDQISQLV